MADAGRAGLGAGGAGRGLRGAEAKFLTCAGAGNAGTRAGNAETRHGRSKMELCWLPPPTPHSPPGARRGLRGKEGESQPAGQTDRKSPRTENSGQNFKKKKKKKAKKRGKKCLDQWGIYAKTHMICNVSMRICIRYHHPSCHPGSGSAESYKVKFGPLPRRRRNVIFRRKLGSGGR